ncbi:MAG: hypothetical protein OEM04_04690 [Flavobacteriaceae bacterium]|nr:hypothetical protein [Flavobacteriaceae bacterium]
MIKSLKLITFLIFMALGSCQDKKAVENRSKEMVRVLASPAGNNSMQPYLYSDSDQVIMSWTQKINDSVHVLKYATLSEGQWTQARQIQQGSDWFVNWADFPAIAQNKDQLLVHYLKKSDTATFAYDVQLKQSSDLGESWSDDFKLHQDSTLTEHGFVTILPDKEDGFFITWLDGRNTKGGGHGDEHQSMGAMNIRTATVLANGEIMDDVMVDSKTCDCCQTSAAITTKGPVIVYRDRSDDEVRDIYISRQVGKRWTTPKAIYNDHWKINGCPVNGPKADAYENTLVVAWFTAADNIPEVKLSFSTDDGENMMPPITIAHKKTIGRVDVALIDRENALVSWMQSTDKGAEIKMMKVNIDGSKSAPFIVGEISAARASGFPQFELIDGEIVFAWNTINNNRRSIKTVRFPLEVLN